MNWKQPWCPRAVTAKCSVALMLVLGSGCGASGDLCAALGRTAGCDGTVQSKCESAIASEKSRDSTCAPMITALTACMAPLKLSCSGSSGAAANGDGLFDGPQNFTDVGGFSLVVNDSKCDRYRRGLEACRSCPQAVGAKDVESLGIGDKCTGAGCASGLSCQSGICTRSCTSNDDCLARSDGCRLKVQFPNVCNQGRCTISCSGDLSCEFGVRKGSTCQSGACSL